MTMCIVSAVVTTSPPAKVTARPGGRHADTARLQPALTPAIEGAIVPSVISAK